MVGEGGRAAGDFSWCFSSGSCRSVVLNTTETPYRLQWCKLSDGIPGVCGTPITSNTTKYTYHTYNAGMLCIYGMVFSPMCWTTAQQTCAPL